PILKEIHDRLSFLRDVGLEYLTLGRAAGSLSGGESQRIRLATQIGSRLVGVLYILDEPSIGLHQRDNERLLRTLKELRDLGNTVLVVEHDEDTIRAADYLIDLGPRAGRFGGEVVAQGPVAEVLSHPDSLTGRYLRGELRIPVPALRRPVDRKRSLTVVGAKANNLRNLTVEFPLGVFVAVTGVSGSGKSTLITDILYHSLARHFYRAKVVPGAHRAIEGLGHLDKVIDIDQSPIGRTPRSNPATYTGLFTPIRELFAQLPEAKMRGYGPGRFSFNVKGGRCESCEGDGLVKIEMHFLPDVWVECEACRGRRYNEETLAVRFHGQSIADVLDMSCGRAVTLFEHIPRIRSTLQLLCDVGLDYVKLGQPAPTLSGGEAQRVKLAAELARPDTGRTLYLLDEPTTGLHFEDLAKLLDVLNRLVDLGNTVVVIEHNLDVIKTADWVIDMGPEAGEEGGYVVVAGTPEDVVAHAARAGNSRGKENALLRSYTGEVLQPVLAAGPFSERKKHDFAATLVKRDGDLDIHEVGGEASMPWEIDGRRWHTKDRVGRTGNPCRWDGRILDEVVERIQDSGQFGETDWNSRSIVEIRPPKKSDGWFFHAITGEEWLLKMKFRTAKNTFRREELVARLDLKPLNDTPDLPLYGTEPRAKVTNLRGPWQEVELRVHAYNEIDRPEFWKFVDEAVAGFCKFTERARRNPEDLMPWKVLGRKWHTARKGFHNGRQPVWDVAVLERVFDLLEKTAPHVEFVWSNKQVVPVLVGDQKEPWAAVQTKKTDAVYLRLTGPKGRFTLGRITELGHEPEFDAQKPQYDVIHLKFRSAEDLARGDLAAFLQEHLATLNHTP
ncbi:MAG: excinuclease ABC subunit UvrA, partial [Pirellulales bacterium]|nr:excinuclease ABC subunit UvrA [Pirellulales bacterium]